VLSPLYYELEMVHVNYRHRLVLVLHLILVLFGATVIMLVYMIDYNILELYDLCERYEDCNWY